MFEHDEDRDAVGAGADARPGGSHPVAGLLDAADVVFEQGLDLDPETLDDEALAEALRRVHGLAAKQAELFARLLGEADTRDLGRRQGASSTTAWVRQVLLMRPGAAKAAVDLAHRLTPPVPAEDYAASPSARVDERGMPATREGMITGDISPEHATVIAKTMADLPGDLPAQDAASAEADLAGFARAYDPATLQRLATHLLHVLDTESLEEREQRAARKRRLRLVDQHDGTVRITGMLSTDDAATVRTALDPLAAPCPSDEGERDPRTPEQRRADALTELARRALATDELPTNHGHPTQLLLLADLSTLTGEHVHAGDGAHSDARNGGDTGSARPGSDAAGSSAAAGHRGSRGRRWLQDTWATRFGVPPAELAWGGPVSTETARRLACHATITPILLDPNGVPLRVGRAERSATPGIWNALIARDRGCAFPGCTRPPAWCHAHHIHHWADGGPTDLDNLVLLCGHHHRTIHHAGWHVHLATDGHPEFQPPPWVDPHREPRRNTRPRHNHQPPPADTRPPAGTNPSAATSPPARSRPPTGTNPPATSPPDKPRAAEARPTPGDARSVPDEQRPPGGQETTNHHRRHPPPDEQAAA